MLCLVDIPEAGSLLLSEGTWRRSGSWGEGRLGGGTGSSGGRGNCSWDVAYERRRNKFKKMSVTSFIF